VELLHLFALADVMNQVVRLAAFAHKSHLALPPLQYPLAQSPPEFISVRPGSGHVLVVDNIPLQWLRCKVEIFVAGIKTVYRQDIGCIFVDVNT
jgi:hypothetical protein